MPAARLTVKAGTTVSDDGAHLSSGIRGAAGMGSMLMLHTEGPHVRGLAELLLQKGNVSPCPVSPLRPL